MFCIFRCLCSYMSDHFLFFHQPNYQLIYQHNYLPTYIIIFTIYQLICQITIYHQLNFISLYNHIQNHIHNLFLQIPSKLTGIFLWPRDGGYAGKGHGWNAYEYGEFFFRQRTGDLLSYSFYVCGCGCVCTCMCRYGAACVYERRGVGGGGLFVCIHLNILSFLFIYLSIYFYLYMLLYAY